MKVLVAEDDPTLRSLLQRIVAGAGFQVKAAADGLEALELAEREQPEIIVTDWMMPGLEGVELCRRIRRCAPGRPYTYIIILSVRDQKDDISEGLTAGADDYVVKPFDPVELEARLRVGERIIRLESNLRLRNDELEESLRTIRQLKSLLPICMFCKKIRNDENYWQQLESYIHDQTGADFSHGICPDCFRLHYPDAFERRARQIETPSARTNSSGPAGSSDPSDPTDLLSGA